MATYDNTRDAARQLRDDAQGSMNEMREDARTFFNSLAERLGIVGDDARRLVNDGNAYLQHWLQLLRDDLRGDLRGDIRTMSGSAAAGIAGGFVGAVGFLLLNMGIIWALSAERMGVSQWFIIFGAGWLIVGAALMAGAVMAGRKAVRQTSSRVREDMSLPRSHAKSIAKSVQSEVSHEPPTAH